MKVLVVSFDKTLTESLVSALSGHEVHVAKNTEEAIKMMPSDIEGVIYDAISGAISEEDINTLYTKKFSNARYVILYDELFPVDANNIIVPQKILIPRDESPEEIVRKLEEFPVEEPQEETPPAPAEEISTEAPEEFEIETTSFETSAVPEAVIEEAAESVEEAIKEIEASQEEKPDAEEGAAGEESPEKVQPSGVRRILIVSFDQTLVDSLESVLGANYEISSVKTVKQALEEGKKADMIVFDAISGVIAEKGLVDMAGDPDLSQKFYLILIDDLFPINVDSIPLERKVAVSRDTDPGRLKEIVEENLSSTPLAEREVSEQPEAESLPSEEEAVAQEEPPEVEITPQTPQIPEVEVTAEEPPQEEEIPALATLERIIEEKGLGEDKSEEEPEEAEEKAGETSPPQTAPTVHIPQEQIARLIEEAVSRSLSEERVREIFSQIVGERVEGVKDMISEIIRKEVERAFEEMDIRNIIRQATYQVLKERLEELIS